MPKNKLKTPEWITKGYDSEADYNKAKGIDNKKKTGKTFKIRKCPKCDSDNVCVVVGKKARQEAEPLATSSKLGQSKGEWECKKCGWKGKDIKQDEISEEEFMKYLDNKGEEVS